jgi:hypothetical protein
VLADVDSAGVGEYTQQFSKPHNTSLVSLLSASRYHHYTNGNLTSKADTQAQEKGIERWDSPLDMTDKKKDV